MEWKLIEYFKIVGDAMYTITDSIIMRLLSVLCVLYIAWLVVCVPNILYMLGIFCVLYVAWLVVYMLMGGK